MLSAFPLWHKFLSFSSFFLLLLFHLFISPSFSLSLLFFCLSSSLISLNLYRFVRPTEKPRTNEKGGLSRHLKVLWQKNIDTRVEKKNEKETERRYGGERADRIVTEVDRRSLAGLSVRTNEKGEFNNDTSLLLGFPLCRDKLIKM